MTVLLPDIGRNGIVNSVRRLSGLNNPGYRAVDSAAEFVAGMVANLEAGANGPVLTVANNSDTAIVGIFYCHKTTSFYRPIIEESQTFGTSPNSSTVAYLNHANLKSSATTLVTDSTGNTTYVDGDDYDLSTTNGTISLAGRSGHIGGTDTILISYLYLDPNLSGIDQTLGSGLAATLEDRGEIATLIYDPAQTYTLMGSLYSDANGYITATSGGIVIGKVTKVPTAEDPELHFKLTV
jgi:hypothetical protein